MRLRLLVTAFDGFGESVSSANAVFYDGAPHGLTVDLQQGTIRGEGRDRVARMDEIAVWGSPHDDTMLGNDLRNMFQGLGGDDTLAGLGGGDWLDGGPGRGLVDGGKGADFLFGSDTGTVLGGSGDDQIDAVRYDFESDEYLPANTEIRAGGGDDVVSFAFPTVEDAGPDVILDGGPGIDFVDVGLLHGLATRIDNVAGTLSWQDRAVPLVGFEEFSPRGRVELDFQGSGVDEVVYGVDTRGLRAVMGGGDDTVSGSVADDDFDGGDGADEVTCGGGNDTQVNFETVHCP